MNTLSEQRIAELLRPYLARQAATGSPALKVCEEGEMFVRLGTYLELLLRWNARTNLTAIRAPEAIVQRHFGESLFAGLGLVGRVGNGATMLDYGSGAGFPGIPIQLLLPELAVTLAESQGKKAAFLREVVRVLGLRSVVWAERVERMPANRQFEVVTMRAVDRMDAAGADALERVAHGGWLVELGTERADAASESVQIPGLDCGRVHFIRKGS